MSEGNKAVGRMTYSPEVPEDLERPIYQGHNRAVAGGPALPPFSGMAVTAFVLSLLWLGGLGSLLGVFLSAFAVKETKSGRRAGRSLAVAALILSIMGLIVPLIVLVGVMILGNQLADQFNQVSQQVGG